jgi:tetratricopeptide (TPR) repeat protein
VSEEVNVEMLQAITPEESRARMGRGGRVNWINRGVTEVAQLRGHDRILIAGRMKVGKTREAVELVRRAVDEDLIPETQIFELAPGFRLLAAGALPSVLRRTVATEIPVLILVDDLPRHCFGQGLARLGEALTVLEACTVCYVVATARSDQLTDAQKTWLDEQGFRIIELPELDAGQTGRLLDGAAGTYELYVGDRARDEFVAQGDGTPELLLASLRRLWAEGVRQVGRKEARRVAERSLEEAWAEARRTIGERVAGAGPLFESLATFHAARVNAHTSLVMPYAARLWRAGERRWQPWGTMGSLQQALAYLESFDFKAAQREIYYPDVAVEGLIEVEEAGERLGPFLMRHRWYLQWWGLRRLHSDALAHMCALFDLALGREEQGELEAASRLYGVGLRVQPHPQLYYKRGVLRQALGDPKGALKDLDRAIARDPQAAAVDTHRDATRQDLGGAEAAIDDSDQAITIDPHYATIYLHRGNARAGLGDLQAAIHDYDQAIALDPHDARTYLQRGNVRAGLGNLEAALDDYSQALALDPHDASAYNNRGLARRDLGNFRAAIDDLDQAIALDPQNAAAYGNRGLVRFDLGDVQDAIEDLDQAIALFSDDADKARAYYSRGLARFELGDLQAAIDDYDQTLVLDPHDASAHYHRGLARHDLGDLVAAIDDYDQAIPLLPNGPDLATAYYNRGMALQALGVFQAAIEDYDQAVALDLQDASVYYQRGTALQALGALEAAIEDYDLAIALNPEDAAAYNNRGIALRHLGDLQAAIDDYYQAISLFPDGPDRAKAYYNRGLAHYALDDLQVAVYDYAQAIDLDPQDARAYYHRGLAHKELGDLQGALDDYAQAIALDPEYAEAYAGKAGVHAQRGEVEEACASLEEAIGLDDAFRTWAGRAADFAGLWGNARFEALVVGEG